MNLLPALLLLGAQSIEFHKVVATGDAVPGLGTVTGLGGGLSIDGDQVGFLAYGGAGGYELVYALGPSAFTVATGPDDFMPESGAPMDNLGNPSLRAGQLLFAASRTYQYDEENIVTVPGSRQFQLVSGQGGGVVLYRYRPTWDGQYVNYATGTSSDLWSLYAQPAFGGARTLLASRGLASPSGAQFLSILDYAIGGGQTVFSSTLYNHPAGESGNGLFRYDNLLGGLTVIADYHTPFPDYPEHFYNFTAADTDGRDVVFYGGTRYPLFGGHQGIYFGALGGALQKVIDQRDFLPGTNLPANAYGGLALDQGFLAMDLAHNSYSDFGTAGWLPGATPFWILRNHDLLDGQPVVSVSVTSEAVSGNRVGLFVELPNFRYAFYVATVYTLQLREELRRGQPVRLTARGGRPGEPVTFLYSLTGLGAGPCLPQLGGLCLDLLAPVHNAGTAATAADGSATFQATLPANAPLATVYLQAVLARGGASVKTNPVSGRIRP